MGANITELDAAENVSITREIDADAPAWLLLELLAATAGSGVLIYLYVWPHPIVALLGAILCGRLFFLMSLSPATTAVLSATYGLAAGVLAYLLSGGDLIWTGFVAVNVGLMRYALGRRRRRLQELGLYEDPDTSV